MDDQCRVGEWISSAETPNTSGVTAPNAQEALHRAASLFRIEPAQYTKLMITKIEEQRQDRFVD
jgi:hypothetical protein